VNRRNDDRVEVDAEASTVSVAGTTMVEMRAEGAVTTDAAAKMIGNACPVGTVRALVRAALAVPAREAA